ncbi:MAG: hypothetical protein AAF990_26140 [Bacteroidota bacterium]
MTRRNIPQIIYQPWFPSFLKNCVHEFLTWFVIQINAAKPFMPIIERGLKYSSDDSIINIEQDTGAGISTLRPFLSPSTSISNIRIEQLDAEKIKLNGLFVSINSFHQLTRDQATTLLTKVAKSNRPIAILEGNNDSLWQVVGMLFFVPLTIILTTPLVKPFRLSRIIFTYLIPILPLVTLIDGFIALFKLYSPQDLTELTDNIRIVDYTWESGKLDNGRGGKIIYLLGIPQNR